MTKITTLFGMTHNLFSKVEKIEVEKVKRAIDIKEDMQLLDVRTKQEYEREHIRGSINIPVDNIVDKVQKFLPDKKKKIYVYCLSGSRSAVAVATMLRLGYTNVFSMNNGLLGWRVKGFSL